MSAETSIGDNRNNGNGDQKPPDQTFKERILALVASPEESHDKTYSSLPDITSLSSAEQAAAVLHEIFERQDKRSALVAHVVSGDPADSRTERFAKRTAVQLFPPINGGVTEEERHAYALASRLVTYEKQTGRFPTIATARIIYTPYIPAITSPDAAPQHPGLPIMPGKLPTPHVRGYRTISNSRL